MHLDRVLTVPEGSVLLASSDSAGQARAAAGVVAEQGRWTGCRGRVSAASTH